MKNINFKTILGTAVFALLAFSCSNDILDETPRTDYTPDYFKTEEGIQGGLTSLYAHTRYIFGQYYYAAQQNGTDEYTYAQSADNNFKDSDMSGAGSLTPSSSRSDALWNAAYSNINTASGIIENASDAGKTEALISEARFFRAWDYFQLVQTFGGVPLDLGSGELKFNVTPSRTSVRNTVPEVYTKAIFPDLKTAIENLPDAGRVTGGVTKTAARLYLAKAYLAYGWWLQNPGNIPTYPETTRTDPDGHDAAWYFQQAYNTSLEGINNAGSNFGLQQYFYDVNLGSNDRNKEIVLYSDHCEDEYYNQASLSWSNGTVPESFAVWFATCNYGDIRSSDGSSYGVVAVDRDATQWGGRPWTRMAPPIEVFTKTFADKTNDSRYDGTFAAVFPGNWGKKGDTRTLYNANGLPVKSGEAVLTFLNEDNPAVAYPSGGGDSNVGGGTLPGRADWVINPSGISRLYYPGLWKLGTYRTDNGSGLGQPNGAITRPWNIAKFSEFYLIAAEAAVKGATGTMSARELVNVLRARAGKWRYSNNGQWSMGGDGTKVEDHSAAMIAATPATIDINYILAERSREFFGEGYRWLDLVRTQKWAEIAGSYTICGSAKGDHTPVVYNRSIQPFHYLRPIPQGQIDGMTMTDAEKKAYQNPGY
ncbi:RagB/SusD family nutrient uptake outer membrane protein [Dysgonomonas macrotermitis]|uniref:Starch-binding associating with outer membrane n=1 Tax=Dysgonomonas macrotermitis TaxID=1346286 RepID=A0A1M4SLM0_9BACT|nr:RagB/SusD family nutrient uptake outer membrane protein [Dysgonomonas macrotermitis]SHE32877.1 Starch-binding associating with outer membrane [Dysgonomonas macrotermitis]